MACCALLPLGLFLLFGPMLAAGRGGVRPFLISLTAAWGMVLLLVIANGPSTLDLLADWRDNVPLFIGLGGGLVMSVGMGGLVLWVRSAEDRTPDRTKCRRCGYDLRASPDRCPECGTPVRPDPEWV